MPTLRHCPACAARLAPPDTLGAAQRCAACGATHWRNSKPSVGAVVLRAARGGRAGREVLLSLRARDPARGLWDFPGGFLEWGEAPREGLARELAEETGLDARIGRLLATDVGGYDEEATLNLVYLCEADGEPRASDDSAELRWFPLDALPPLAFPHEARVLAALARGDDVAP